jgi:hypothetical protein
MSIEAMKQALNKAFNLGQTYWQQANSEYRSYWIKADVTQVSFEQLVEETCQAVEQAQKQEPVIDKAAAIRIATVLGWTPPRQPLSEEEIEAIAAKIERSDFFDCVVPFARAIEAAHGIKENT